MPDPQLTPNPTAPVACACLGGSTYATDDPAVRRCDLCGGTVPTDPATGDTRNAPVATPDVVEMVCHEEQLQVWADEMLANIAMGGFLREDMDYSDKIDLHHAVMSEIKRIVACAFDHPEAAAEITRLREEVGVAYAHGVTAGADAERKRLEPEIERLRARVARLEQALCDISRDGPTHSCGRRARAALEG